MKNFVNSEDIFLNMGDCWHVWSGEQFETFLYTDDDYITCMGIVAIAAKLCPDISVLTFELMSNHIHLCVSGAEDSINNLISNLRKVLSRAFDFQERPIRWTDFTLNKRRLNSLEDVRNVIAYVNRNGFIANRHYTPLTYPWGANSFFFNDFKCNVTRQELKSVSLRERRRMSRSRIADNVEGLMKDSISVSPLCFCDLDTANALFKDASHYFFKIGRNVEADKQIARECGENIFYTDNELYAAVSAVSQKNYGTGVPATLSIANKIEMVKTMHWDYNANPKQIARILKLEYSYVCRLLGRQQ